MINEWRFQMCYFWIFIMSGRFKKRGPIYKSTCSMITLHLAHLNSLLVKFLLPIIEPPAFYWFLSWTWHTCHIYNGQRTILEITKWLTLFLFHTFRIRDICIFSHVWALWRTICEIIIIIIMNNNNSHIIWISWTDECE